MPFMVMDHSTDPKQTLKKEVGNVDNVEVFNNQVLVAVYTRPEKTKSGIYLTSGTRDEDKIQGKVCLLYTSPSPRDRTRSRMPSSA